MRDALGSVQSVLVLGGGSDIARATVRALVGERVRTVWLAARDPGTLDGDVAALKAAGAETVEVVPFDADAPGTHAEALEPVFAAGDVDVVLLAFGVLGDQETLKRDPGAAVAHVQTNFTGAVSALLVAAERLRAQGHGSLVVLSSVAAERPRRSNFVYGASKAGLDSFAQGLGDELAADGVHVMVVRPGMVRTKMTEGLEDVPFTTTPEKVAREIVKGLRRRAHTVWAPPLLRFVFAGLRHLPRPVFRRLDL